MTDLLSDWDYYKKELSKIETLISKASKDELPLLKDKQQQLIGKISELILSQEVINVDKSNS